jgi:DNA replication protein DnaC
MIMLDEIKFKTDEEIAAYEEETFKKERQAILDKITPHAFAETEQARLPDQQLAEALTWATNKATQPLNLLLAGKTGVGKTRIAWEALKKRFSEWGKNAKGEIISLNVSWRPVAIGAESFTRRLNKEWELMERLQWAKLLLLDDLGKERTTPTAESAIFELIRERMDNGLPTIYTTNFAPSTLVKRFVQTETGEAVSRRLKESSLNLVFPSAGQE